ncbi:MAG: hypothetical protein ACFBZ8_07745 [Opitutales bacterium]
MSDPADSTSEPDPVSDAASAKTDAEPSGETASEERPRRSRRNRSLKRSFPETPGASAAASARAKPGEIANVHGVVENLSGMHAAGYQDRPTRPKEARTGYERRERKPRRDERDATTETASESEGPKSPMEGNKEEWSPRRRRDSTREPGELGDDPSYGGQVDRGGGKLPSSSDRRDEDRAVRELRRRMRKDEQPKTREPSKRAAQKHLIPEKSKKPSGLFGRLINGFMAFIKGPEAMEDHYEARDRERRQNKRSKRSGSKSSDSSSSSAASSKSASKERSTSHSRSSSSSSRGERSGRASRGQGGRRSDADESRREGGGERSSSQAGKRSRSRSSGRER